MNEAPIIVALDFETAAQARELVQQLGTEATWYKVGLELYTAAGMDFVRELIAAWKNVFLDLKMYDIPETVKRAVAQAAKTDVRFLTIHGSNAIMRAAVEGRGDSDLELLAVTVLTSFDQEDLQDLGYPVAVQDLVAHRVRNAIASGMDGIVCSPLEVRGVRVIAGPDAVLVTPGVRSKGAETGDQKRVATPAEAFGNGANFIVVGRQVVRAPDPRAAFEGIRAEIGAIARPAHT
jgi:orotidine-5'-phosphate decarboxylase